MSAISDPSSAIEAFRQLGRLLAEISLRAEERAKATHSRFNVFTTLLKENDEVRLHTRFLHALLDPEGQHDCGSLFLDLFLKRLPIEELDVGGVSGIPVADDGWTVKKEAGRSKGFGQIDLLLEHRLFGIAIENKIHAYEQRGQLASYAAYLRGRYGDGFLLIFLTLDGKESGTHEGVPYLRLSYANHILPWLDECLRETYAIIPVNQLLLQYREVVRSLTGKTLAATMMKPVVDFISVTPDLIRHREVWYQAVDEAKVLILDRVAKEVIGRLPGDLSAVLDPNNDEGRFGTEWGGLFIRGKGGELLLPEPLEVCFENSTEDGDFSLGIYTGRYDKPALSKELREWLERVKAVWADDPAGAETLENKGNPAWPLGWATLGRLDDEGIANLIEPGRFDEAVSRFVDRITEFTMALRRVTSAVGRTIP